MLAIVKYIIRQYRHCAARRNIPFMLTDDQVMAFLDCECVYCGAKNTNRAYRKQYAVKEFWYNGIDRINSDQGYTISNTVACCKQCNAAKSDTSVEFFMASEWLKLRIAEIMGAM
jgi:hypothetical protein